MSDDSRHARVRSYARRGSRLNVGQQSAWDSHREVWVLPDEVAAGGLDQVAWFGREAPLVVEIGSGNGESLAEMAAALPDCNVLALEVWRPGVAATLQRLARTDVGNVRLLMADAETCLETLVPPGGLSQLWTFFPDPWHKKRHHKRRLVGPTFARVAASRLAVGGTWRLATDWEDYARHAEQVLANVPELRGGRVARPSDRPVTKFERRGLAAGREIVDFVYERVGVPSEQDHR